MGCGSARFDVSLCFREKFGGGDVFIWGFLFLSISEWICGGGERSRRWDGCVGLGLCCLESFARDEGGGMPAQRKEGVNVLGVSVWLLKCRGGRISL